MNIIKLTGRIIPVFAALLFVGCDPVEDPVEPAEVAAPSGVTLVASESSSLSFAWEEVEGAVYYTARLETPSGELAPGGQTTTKEPSFTFKGLQPGAEYAFMVKVKVGNVESPYSQALIAKTLSQEHGPEPQPVPSDIYDQFKIPAAEDVHGQTLAFPGAEGGGMYTSGGRGGKVIHVTTLADSGEGSLRAALAESGARTIVFDVAGIIDLKSTLKISKGDVTIAGQTAPGDGICIRNYPTQIESSGGNIIIRFIRFRMGDEAKQENDALWGRYNENIIIDHCSMSWSTDECSSFYANVNFTMQWCILTESLRVSVHGKGNHGYGGIWGGKDASFHHNLLANHDSRNPRIDHPQIYGDYVDTHRGSVDYRNNAVYNWGSNSTYGGEDGWFNIVNNYYKPGPASSDRKYFVDAYGSYVKDGVTYADRYAELYLSGNVHTLHDDITAANDASSIYWHDKLTTHANYNTVMAAPHVLAGPSSEDVYTTTHSAEDAFARICGYAGASLSRDSVDERACGDAKAGKATFADGGNGSKNGIIDTQSAVGGWPAYEAAASELEKVVDADGDGMPDWFEDKFGLDKSSAADGNVKTLDKFGRYTNLEMYLHYLVKDIVEAQNAGGSYDNLS